MKPWPSRSRFVTALSPAFLRIVAGGVLLASVARGQARMPVEPVQSGPAHQVRDIEPGRQDFAFAMTEPARIGDVLLSWIQNAESPSGDPLLWGIDTAAGRASLLKEITPLYNPLYVSQPFVSLGDRLYFTAYAVRNVGSGPPLILLWSTDGTPGGTVSFARSGGGGYTYPAALTLFHGKLYFFASAGEPLDFKLWKSDGTAEGTVAIEGVAGIPPEFVGFEGFAGVGIAQPPMTLIGESLLFFALSNRSPDRPYGLYRTDGTDSGTVLLRDFGVQPDAILSTGNIGYFVETDTYGVGGHGQELWRTDGTPEGTMMLRDICPGPCDSYPTSLTVVGDILYFAISGPNFATQVWKSDGTETGTTLLAQVRSGPGPPPHGFVAANGQVFFLADDGVHGEELWRTDGSAEGTRLVKDVRPGPDASGISNLVLFGPWLLFTADDGIHGQELWRTDGTALGTVLVADIAPGSTPSSPQTLVAYRDAVYFSADDSFHGRELWQTDGTPVGTQFVTDLMPGPMGSNPFLVSNPVESLLFLAVDPDRLSLWKIAGSTSGIRRVATIDSGAPGLSSNPSSLTDVGGQLCFFTNSGRYAEMSKLWTSDGTEAGTRFLQTAEPHSTVEPTEPGAVAPISIGKSLYFDGFTEGGGFNDRLYRLDLDTNTLQPLADTFASGRAAIGHTLFFSLNFSELWKTDSLSGDVTLVKRFDGAVIHYLGVWGGTLYFLAGNGSETSVWMSDGTEAGTVQTSNSIAFAVNLTIVGRAFFFTSPHSVSEELSLWVFNQGSPSPTLVKSFPAAGDSLFNLTAAGDLLFFVRQDSQSGSLQLWRSDGTGPGTFLLRAGSLGSLESDGSQLYFVATDPVSGSELWRSDGTPQGTALVKDVNPGLADSNPSALTVIDGILLFAADDGLHGRELWRSDGTSEGTSLLQDICPDSCSSGPGGFTKSGSLIFFSANDQESGNELWAMPVSAVGSRPGRATPPPLAPRR